MAPIDDETLDRLLKRSVSAQLDGHLGRAEPAFRQQWVETSGAPAPLRLAGEGPSARGRRASQQDVRESRWNRWLHNGRWFAGIAGTALAASVATLLVLPHVWTGGGATIPQQTGDPVTPANPSPAAHSTPVATSEHPVVRYIYNQAIDEGPATDEFGHPIRRVRYQQVEHYRYYDPQRKAYIEWTVPREDVQHLKVDSY